MKLRSIELVLPEAVEAARFMTDIWGLKAAAIQGQSHYLRGAGTFPYLLALHEGESSFVRSVTFVCSPSEIEELSRGIAASDLPATPCISDDPGGGHGLLVELPEGELFRFLTDTTLVEPLTGVDMPIQLTHVVFNAADAEASADVAEQILGFRVSDRTRGMVFVRCNQAHHSIAFARAGFSSLNHIAFEMADLDAVMRGIGRMRDHDLHPSWGPGRHGPGDNAFAYYIAPFMAVIEYSTAVETVGDDYPVGVPDDWTWPPRRIDQWGISDKDFAALAPAERHFRFFRDWQPQPWQPQPLPLSLGVVA